MLEFLRSENYGPSDVDIREGKPRFTAPLLLPVTTFPGFLKGDFLRIYVLPKLSGINNFFGCITLI